MPRRRHVECATGQLGVHQVDLLGTKRPRQNPEAGLVVHDGAAQVLLEVGRRGFGRSGDRARGDEVGKQGRVPERRGEVDQQHLLRMLRSQRRACVHGQRADTGTTLGGKESDDRR